MSSIFQLKQTCGGCPEAYNIYCNKTYVGNARLRHGHFAIVDDMGDVVFSENPPGSDGIFANDAVRTDCLTRGLTKLLMSIDWMPTLFSMEGQDDEA